MSKSVLVIDTPEHGCISCLIWQNHSNSLEPAFIARFRKNVYLIKKQKPFLIGVHLWICRKKDNGDYQDNTSDTGFVEGWNQCIDEIAGEVK